MNRKLLAISMAFPLLGLAGNASAAPNMDEMMELLHKQSAQIEALTQRLNASEKATQAADQKAEAAVEAIETVVAAGGSTSGGGWWNRTTVGGYGELHYNNLNGEGGASDKEEFDLHRFVLFFGHEFNDDIRFFSEVEIEHNIAGEGQVGEVEVEQAYVEFDLNEDDSLRAKAGVFLLPVGIINETHEPPTFFGVERNPVEKNIVPATWWAAGAALSGEVGEGISFDIAVHEGLKTDADSSYKPRSGRQKSGQADGSDLAYTARLKYTGIPGLELAGTYHYQSDITQGVDATAGDASLIETHAIFQRGPFGIKALYAMWDLDGDGPKAIGADEQDGWYIEPSYQVNEKWGVFARYNEYDNKAGSSASDSEKQQTDIGINFYPHPDVVLKADYQWQDNDDDKNQDGFNLGVGFQY